ncbi:MAG TPA: methyltransferase domain-containing protein [Candidatus Obscuribacterales bacterium]
MQTRQREPELMDDPALDPSEHIHARAGLARLNALSGAAHGLWQPLQQLMAERNLTSLKVLDIATGAGDVIFRIHRIARQRGVQVEIDGCDFSDTALNHARRSAQRIGAPSKFFKLDVFRDQIPSGYDVVMTSLFTHHLGDDDTVHLLSSMKRAAGQMLIVNDLQRSKFNHALIWLATRICSTSRVVHFDGPASVRNSYTVTELAHLADKAGLHDASLHEVFPCRMMLTWKRTR